MGLDTILFALFLLCPLVIFAQALIIHRQRKAIALLKVELRVAEDLQGAAFTFGKLRSTAWFLAKVEALNESLSGQIVSLNALARQSCLILDLLAQDWDGILEVYPFVAEWEKGEEPS